MIHECRHVLCVLCCFVLYNYIPYLLEDALILVFEIQTLILHCYYSVLEFISTECVAMNYSNKRLVFVVSVHSILNLKTITSTAQQFFTFHATWNFWCINLVLRFKFHLVSNPFSNNLYVKTSKYQSDFYVKTSRLVRPDPGWSSLIYPIKRKLIKRVFSGTKSNYCTQLIW